MPHVFQREDSVFSSDADLWSFGTTAAEVHALGDKSGLDARNMSALENYVQRLPSLGMRFVLFSWGRVFR